MYPTITAKELTLNNTDRDGRSKLFSSARFDWTCPWLLGGKWDIPSQEESSIPIVLLDFGRVQFDISQAMTWASEWARDSGVEVAEATIADCYRYAWQHRLEAMRKATIFSDQLDFSDIPEGDPELVFAQPYGKPDRKLRLMPGWRGFTYPHSYQLAMRMMK